MRNATWHSTPSTEFWVSSHLDLVAYHHPAARGSGAHEAVRTHPHICDIWADTSRWIFVHRLCSWAASTQCEFSYEAVNVPYVWNVCHKVNSCKVFLRCVVSGGSVDEPSDQIFYHKLSSRTVSLQCESSCASSCLSSDWIVSRTWSSGMVSHRSQIRQVSER